MEIDIENMTCEQVAVLERNIAVKNMARKIVAGFKKNVQLSLESKKGYRFTIWADQHNTEYVDVSENGVTYIAEFLHENYSVNINENSIYSGILSGYRGIEHVACKAKVEYNPNKYKINKA